MQNKPYALGLCLMSLITIALLASGMGTIEWTIARTQRVENSTCINVRQIGLFRLQDTFQKDVGCSAEDKQQEGRSVFDTQYINLGLPGLQYATIAFCALAIATCVLIMGVSAYNVCANPYETMCTSFSIMIYNIVGLICSLIAVILYTVLKYTQMDNSLVEETPDNAGSNIYADQYKIISTDFGYSFYLVVLSIITFLAGVILAILSERNVITKLKKMLPDRPEDKVDKSDDVMMF